MREKNQHMHVIGHDHEFVNFNAVIHLLHPVDRFRHSLTDTRKRESDQAAKKTPFVPRTECN